MQEKRWKYLGADESNTGRFPSVYVAVFSNYYDDIIDHSPDSKNQETLLSKIRKHKPQDLLSRLSKRGYSFLSLSKEEYSSMERYRLWGNVLGSLLIGEKVEEVLEVYIDGEMSKKAKDYCRGCLHDVTRLETPRIRLFSGVNFDRKFDLVNIADETAHFIFRKKTENDINNHPNRKFLACF